MVENRGRKPQPVSPAADSQAEKIQLAAAAAVFVVGALIYLFDRSAADIYFIPDWWGFADGVPALFGALGGYLPSFVHTLCFILAINALLTPWRISPLTVCIAWVGVEAFLEIAQAEPIAAFIATALPGWFANWPVLANVPLYFSNGRFDPLDLLCIGIGGVAAWLIIFFTHRLLNIRTGVFHA